MDQVRVIDCNYVEPGLACAYLVIDGDRAIFVENNTNSAVPLLLEALREEGISREAVDYIIITHVHLDHAGGTGNLAKACPNAKILAHPKAAPHIIDPARLIRSSIQVYGEKEYYELYGEILPVPESRVRTIQDGEEIHWGKRILKFLHTKGHANHHFCIYDSLTNGIFTGDTFGLGYGIFRKGKDSLLYPSTTPTDFDPDEALSSVDKILATGADKAYLTHFGAWEDMQGGAAQMREGLSAMKRIWISAEKTGFSGEVLVSFCENRIRSYLEDQIHKKNLSYGEKERRFIGFDSQINAQGIAFKIERSRRTKK
ncbi:MBL fold metallo-hydrolase [Leptospira wolffii]|uniref:MBL fold metallo-hydrolase n=1 Tax=Leptospira wolffii TaxID=409998 RepID=UPI00034D7288|nr:MBL fold metallo-hydrolase [Leptospira wolffii]TGK62510.1 MBL fold metallo-hydrolase [Leptospira wolffii]TGK66053.1 MBL fold metallo-hydrolase [Leptospira wolffii]TGK74105.1 MBL fold metallo-hydrolase [Leptospira wolffii]TGL28964.1 MBL fold metallo-hydrolase [Leptospira wolffii]